MIIINEVAKYNWISQNYAIRFCHVTCVCKILLISGMYVSVDSQLINHGVPESLMNGMIDVCHKFFQLPEEDKKRLETSYGVDPEKEKNKLQTNFGLDPIKYGTGGNIWRDYIQVIVYPEFHTLDKPAEFR